VAKPQTAAGYSADQLRLAKSTCLSLATVLGDLMSDLVIVGGLVPSLLIDSPLSRREPHVGSLDVDLGLQLAILDQGRYHAVVDRLRSRGFGPDATPESKTVRQRWKHSNTGATVDFLIAPGSGVGEGRLQDLEADIAAVVVPGLALAFRDRQMVALAGRTLDRESTKREIPVCGIGSFVVLKSLALRNRGEPKDAYDLWYVLSHFGDSVDDVAVRLGPLMDDKVARRAVEYLREDFATVDSIGPSRAAEFLSRKGDDDFRADAAGQVARLLKVLRG